MMHLDSLATLGQPNLCSTKKDTTLRYQVNASQTLPSQLIDLSAPLIFLSSSLPQTNKITFVLSTPTFIDWREQWNVLLNPGRTDRNINHIPLRSSSYTTTHYFPFPQMMDSSTFRGLRTIAENIEDDSTSKPSTKPSESTKSLRPLFRLNDTTLQSIFLLASADALFCRNDTLQCRASTARHSAQVCKRWRALAIQIPYIWLGPVLSMAWTSSHNWIRIVLQRSAPLSIYDVEIPPALSQTRYYYIINELSNLQHCRKLKISITPTINADSHADETNDSDAEIYRRLPLYLMDNLSVGRPVRRNSASPRYSPMTVPRKYRNMREMKFSQNTSLPVIELLKALRNMEQLEMLHIQRPYDSSSAETLLDLPTLPPNKHVVLGKLTTLIVSAPISTCACILKNIRIRLSCATKFDCHLADAGPYLDEILGYFEWAMKYWGCDPIQGGSQFLRMDSSHIEYTLEVPKEDLFESALEEQYDGKYHPDMSLALYWPRINSSREEQTAKITALISRCMLVFQVCYQLPVTLDVDIDNDLKITDELQKAIIGWLREVSKNDSEAPIQDLKFRTWTSVCLFLEAFRDENILSELTGLAFYDMEFEGSQVMVQRVWTMLLYCLQERDGGEQSNCVIDCIRCEFSDFNGMLRMAKDAVAVFSIDGKEYNDIGPNDYDMDEDSDGYGSDDTINGL